MPLCIIDMQDEFYATRDAIPGVLREIKLAQERNDHIFLVEFRGCGPSNHTILEALRGYRRVHHVLKSDNDGSDEICRIARRKRIKFDVVRVVGVNLSWCVAETVFGLSFKKMVGKIIVPLKATACAEGMAEGKQVINRIKNNNGGKSIRIVA